VAPARSAILSYSIDHFQYDVSLTTYLGTVLVIDDDHDLRLSLAEDLRRLNWIVETAATGQTGIDAAMKGQPDIVITELALPDVQALSFARTLRSCIEDDALIVGITSTPAQLQADARTSGFDLVFAKPVDVDALQAALVARPAAKRLDDDNARATTKMDRLKR